MKPTRAFKQTLLLRMLLGLRLSAAAPLTLQQRKAAVRLAADAAMASARGARCRWTRALASRLLHRDPRRGGGRSSMQSSFLRFVLGERFVAQLSRPQPPRRGRKSAGRSMATCSAAVRRRRRSLVEKRTLELKRLVPGGEGMSGLSLVDESLDYVVALAAQVELMQSLLTTLEASKLRAENGCTILPELRSFINL